LDTETWVVGPEYEGPQFGMLGRALRDLGYVLSSQEYGVGGSQEIRTWRVVGPSGELDVDGHSDLAFTLDVLVNYAVYALLNAGLVFAVAVPIYLRGKWWSSLTEAKAL
jgi:hypothetical protein